MPIFVGLDCGGSSSRTVAEDANGEVVYRGHSGSANLLSTPPVNLRQNLVSATQGCPAADAVCGCFAGLIDEETRGEALALLAEIFPSAKVRAEPDYAAVIAACGPSADLCVIAGTGSIVCSRKEFGWAKTGGRGPLLQDPGSAAEVGRECLTALLDDQAVSDEFRSAVEKVFGTTDPAPLVSRLYRTKAPAAAMAKLVRPAALEASRGNERFAALIREEMRLLAAMVSRHIEDFVSQRGTIEMGLAGGLWRSHPLYAQTFGQEIGSAMPNETIKLFSLSKPPVEGAVLLAKELLLGH